MAGEWQQKPLVELCLYLNRGSAPAYVTTGGVLVLNQKCVRDQRVEFLEARCTDAASKPITAERMLCPWDVVVNSTGVGTLGRVAQVKTLPGPATVDSHMTIVRPDPRVIDPEYLGLVVRLFETQIKELGEGSTGQTELSRGRLGSLVVPVAPRSEQRAIAHILGTLDDRIELNRKMNEALEAMARALFKSWFIDFDAVRAKAEGRDPGLPADIISLFPDSFEDSDLGEIPKGWTLGVLDQLVDRVLGGDWGADEGTDETSESVRCIRGADIPDLQTGGTGKMPARFLKRTSLEKRRLSDGDVVVEISGGSPTQSTGRPVLVSGALLGRLDMALVCSNFCRVVKLKSPALSKFVYLWLRSLYANDEFFQFENGTTGIKNLAFTRFSSDYKLCVPPLKVLKTFDQYVSPLFEKQQMNAAETDTLSALRDTLLPELLSGELPVQDVAKSERRFP